MVGNGSSIDEFTSTIDRDTAKSLSNSIGRYIRGSGLERVVFATCHYDVEEWLLPDWVFDTITWAMLDRGCLRRPKIEIQIEPCHPKEVWPIFSPHHYLTAQINASCNAWVVFWGDRLVGFTSIIAFPNGNFSNAWREHRTVILPEFQGLGIGRAAIEAVGDMLISYGCRLFSKTVHPSFGIHRNKSDRWRQTSKNGMARRDYENAKCITKEDGHKMRHTNRVAYSHEYIGHKPTQGATS